MIKLAWSIYRTMKPWKIPTKADGMTIDNATLARLLRRPK